VKAVRITPITDIATYFHLWTLIVACRFGAIDWILSVSPRLAANRRSTRLPGFIPQCLSHWPKAKLQLVTNGCFLHRNPKLLRVFRDDPDITTSLSIHHNSAGYRQRLVPIVAMLVH